MREKQNSQGHDPNKWDESRVRTALVIARYHAGRFARQRRFARVDREDLTQDILLAMLEAGPRYDAERASWATFVAVLARRAVIDRARQPTSPETVSLDGGAAADFLRSLAVPQGDPDIAVAFGRVDDVLPPLPQALLRRIIAHSDVPAARDASGASFATFYRDLHDLRCWLRTLGVRPTAPASARTATSMPSGS